MDYKSSKIEQHLVGREMVKLKQACAANFPKVDSVQGDFFGGVVLQIRANGVPVPVIVK